MRGQKRAASVFEKENAVVDEPAAKRQRRAAETMVVFIVTITEFVDDSRMRGQAPSWLRVGGVFRSLQAASERVAELKRTFVDEYLEEQDAVDAADFARLGLPTKTEHTPEEGNKVVLDYERAFDVINRKCEYVDEACSIAIHKESVILDEEGVDKAQADGDAAK